MRHNTIDNKHQRREITFQGTQTHESAHFGFGPCRARGPTVAPMDLARPAIGGAPGQAPVKVPIARNRFGRPFHPESPVQEISTRKRTCLVLRVHGVAALGLVIAAEAERARGRWRHDRKHARMHTDNCSIPNENNGSEGQLFPGIWGPESRKHRCSIIVSETAEHTHMNGSCGTGPA